MKTMRYRIRVIALALVAALLAVLLWSVRAAWLPSGEPQDIPQESAVSLSPDPAVPDASPAPDESPSTLPEETATPEPLFDTFGL